MNKDILLCGIGGQGTVLASKLIAATAMREGHVVHSAETIGMSQRGGSVTSHVRIGNDVYSPLIPIGNADIIMAFEPSEAVRNLPYLKKDGYIVVNKIPVKPVTDSLSDSKYNSEEMLYYLKKKCNNLIILDSEEILNELNASNGFNVAMLGAVIGTGIAGLCADEVINEIKESVKPEYVELNIKAFNIGLKKGER